MPGPTAALDHPVTGPKAITALAGGASRNDVARMLGLNRHTVNKWANKEEIQAEIQAQAAALLQLAPKAVEIKAKTIQAGKKALEKEMAGDDAREGRGNDLKMITVANSAADTVLQTAGILPSHYQAGGASSLMFIDARSVHVTGTVGELLRRHFGSVTEEAIEVDSPPDEG